MNNIFLKMDEWESVKDPQLRIDIEKTLGTRIFL